MAAELWRAAGPALIGTLALGPAGCSSPCSGPVAGRWIQIDHPVGTAPNVAIFRDDNCQWSAKYDFTDQEELLDTGSADSGSEQAHIRGPSHYRTSGRSITLDWGEAELVGDHLVLTVDENVYTMERIGGPAVPPLEIDASSASDELTGFVSLYILDWDRSNLCSGYWDIENARASLCEGCGMSFDVDLRLDDATCGLSDYDPTSGTLRFQNWNVYWSGGLWYGETEVFWGEYAKLYSADGELWGFEWGSGTSNPYYSYQYNGTGYYYLWGGSIQF